MSNQNGYLGRSPGDSAVIIASQTFEPTGIQTDFTFAAGYTVGYMDVYLNGARLIYANDYVASDGSTVGLTSVANSGDVLELVAYKAFNVGNVDAANGNFNVGSNLTVVGHTTATTAYYTGIVTASSFSGDGSGLTGVASTDNIITGTAVTITNTTNSTSTTTGALIVSGGVGVALSMTVGGSLSVGGTITYEDVTNQDVLGLSTFRSGVQFGVAGVGGTIRANGDTTLAGVVTATSFYDSSGVALANTAHVSTTGLVVVGVSTLSGNVQIPDSTSLYLGNDDDLELFHTAGGNTYIKNNTGELEIRGNTTKIFNKSSSQTIAGFTQGASVGITTVGILTAYSDVAIGVGATIHASSGNAVFAGIVTATTLKYGTTSVETAIDAKASTGKAIAMAMVFGF